MTLTASAYLTYCQSPQNQPDSVWLPAHTLHFLSQGFPIAMETETCDSSGTVQAQPWKRMPMSSPLPLNDQQGRRSLVKWLPLVAGAWIGPSFSWGY